MRKNVNSQQVLFSDGEKIRKKKFLKNIYLDFYSQFKNTKYPKDGKVIELGSGAGFLKEIMPKVVTSDVLAGPTIDKVLKAEKIPYKNNSIAGFVMIDVLHHIKNSEAAFKEMERCLIKSGKIVMIEPYNSLWGGLIYKYLHYEHFDPKAGWKVQGKGRMSDSNTALPWIIFKRDRKIFEKKFPSLKIRKVRPHSPFRYLLSGGLSKPQLIPTFLYSAVRYFEDKTLLPLLPYLGMFVTIKLEKVK